jgi:uncharacterized protein with PQ loop repeat
LGKAETLITAESIIAGFLIAIASTYNQLNVQYTGAGKSYLTPYLGGLLIAALTITAFRSVLLTFDYVHKKNEKKYEIAYDLFIIVVIGAILLVIAGVISLVDIVTRQQYTPIPVSVPGSIFVVLGVIFGAYVVLVLLAPQLVSNLLRRLLGLFE